MESLDCKRFQKVAGADLSALDDSLLVHAEGCDDCCRFLEESQQFDEALIAAIKIDVPEGLIDEALEQMGSAKQSHSGTPSRGPRYLAIAASVLLMVGASFMATKLTKQPVQSLEQVVLSHIEAEPEMLKLASYMPNEGVRSHLLDFGVKMTGSIGKVAHIELCDIGDTQGIHVVMKGEKGPVTLLLLPTIKSRAVTTFSEGSWVGYTEPVGQGTMAIVGAPGEPLEKIDATVRKAITWL